jgi:hypothetical protein
MKSSQVNVTHQKTDRVPFLHPVNFIWVAAEILSVQHFKSNSILPHTVFRTCSKKQHGNTENYNIETWNYTFSYLIVLTTIININILFLFIYIFFLTYVSFSSL